MFVLQKEPKQKRKSRTKKSLINCDVEWLKSQTGELGFLEAIEPSTSKTT